MVIYIVSRATVYLLLMRCRGQNRIVIVYLFAGAEEQYNFEVRQIKEYQDENFFSHFSPNITLVSL